jgi:putative Holliday junction resolvase
LRILGIDHGEARIGLAISDEGERVARPLQILAHSSRAADAEAIVRLATEHNVGKIVIGLPTDDEGDGRPIARIGPQTRKVQRWAEALKAATTIPIEFWDESLSSAEARESRGQKKHKRRRPLDAEAAAFILQSYLDAHRPAT